jgi:hypothetical protein
MREENRPSGLGWPAAEPRPADAPRPTTEPRTAGDSRATDDGRPFWFLSSGDQHDLWLSFLGSIVSGVVLAVILGGAIALARAGRTLGLGNLVVLTLGLGFFTFGIIGGRWLARRRGYTTVGDTSEDTRLVAWVIWFAPGILMAGFVALILIWIGVAAGIK